MPFRVRFDCLWCGTTHAVRAPDDLAGWAQLCPACLGRAGTNPFLRDRLRAALAERGGSAADPARPTAAASLPTAAASLPPALPASPSTVTQTRRATRNAALPDDWFLRRGPFERGAVHDAAWQAELDMVTRWLDGLPLGGVIDEPAAGTGFFSPLLAEKGELHASDEDGAALDLARERLVAHRLLAHLHTADPWQARPDGPADAVVASFLVGRVRGAGLDAAADSLRARLRSGGTLVLIDLRPDPAGGPPGGVAWSWHEPAILEAALARAGFVDIALTTTGRFFLLLAARAG